MASQLVPGTRGHESAGLFGSLVVQTGACTSTGRVRSVNEDSYAVTDRLWLVADGMGGHAAGDRASAIAVEHLAGSEASVVTAGALHLALIAAHEAILEEGARRGVSMGTTVAGAVLVLVAGAPHWLVFNVGDSRVYLLTAGRLSQVTVDHSEVQELVDAGRIAPSEAAAHPRRHVVTRALGVDGTPLEDQWLIPADGDQTLLVCSDGLTTELDDEHLAAVLQAGSSAYDAAARLVSDAEDAGGRDNITVVVAHVGTATSEDDDPTQDASIRVGDTVPRSSVTEATT